MYFKLRYNYPMDDDGGHYMPKDGMDFDGVDGWALGKAFEKPPPQPIRIELVPVEGYTGEPPAMFDRYMCLMSEAMVDALLGAGVDNLDTYPAILVDSLNQREFRYVAVNILGLVSMADVANAWWSKFDHHAQRETRTCANLITT